MNGMSPVCALVVGGLAAVGVAGIVMISTNGGRKILTNVCNCACQCMETASSAAQEIAGEMKNCVSGNCGNGNNGNSGN